MVALAGVHSYIVRDTSSGRVDVATAGGPEEIIAISNTANGVSIASTEDATEQDFDITNTAGGDVTIVSLAGSHDYVVQDTLAGQVNITTAGGTNETMVVSNTLDGVSITSAINRPIRFSPSALLLPGTARRFRGSAWAARTTS